jgi:ectoine hydroxylase-related dioxygenase (phytanoyl-CoA dioxygenase family)
LIDESLIRQYEADGAVCVRGVLSREQASDVLANIDQLIDSDEDRWTTIRNGGFCDRRLWPDQPWMYDLCATSPLPELVGGLMRSTEARLYFDHIFVRDAGTRQTTPWHQDRPYWPFLGNQIASAWVALTACDKDSSTLRFIRGSHKDGKIYRPMPFSDAGGATEFLGDTEEPDVMPDYDANPDDYEILCWDVEPGDVIVFGAEIVHGAAENNNLTERRAALSVRYIGDDARWDPRPGTDPMVNEDMVSIGPGDPPHDDEYFPKVWNSDLTVR